MSDLCPSHCPAVGPSASPLPSLSSSCELGVWEDCLHSPSLPWHFVTVTVQQGAQGGRNSGCKLLLFKSCLCQGLQIL